MEAVNYDENILLSLVIWSTSFPGPLPVISKGKALGKRLLFDDVSGSGISIKATTKRKLNKARLLMFDQAIDGSTR